MEISPTVWWILGLLFVYIFGLYEGRGQGYKRRKKEEEQEAKEKPFPPIVPATITVDDPGLIRIKNDNGMYALDLDGARVDATALNADQRKRLIEILNIIRPWLEGKPAPMPPQGTPSSVVTQSRPLDLAPSKTASAPSAPPPPPAAPASRPQATAPKPTINAEDRPVAPANSIVGQIDTILQTRLADTPLAEKGIFLAQSPEGGVLVYVGLDKYNGVDDVPDAEIKSVIRAAIAEWEKKYTPGL